MTLANELRDWADVLDSTIDGDAIDLLEQSADALDELSASVDELSLLVEGRQEVIVALTRRIDVLENALREIADTSMESPSNRNVWWWIGKKGGRAPWLVAREALTAATPTGDQP